MSWKDEAHEDDIVACSKWVLVEQEMKRLRHVGGVESVSKLSEPEFEIAMKCT
jgi:hypothetical protein